MNKKLVIAGTILLVAVVGILFFLNNKESNVDSAKENTTQTSTQSSSDEYATQNPSIASATSGQYLEYSLENFENTVSKNRVLFFYASWCPDCRYFEQVINDSQLPEDLVILQVDYDSSVDLKRQYGVTYQSTLVLVDENGEFVDSWNTVETPTIDDVVDRIASQA